MVQAPSPEVAESLISLDAFLALPETKPASEFVDGRIIQKAMPQGKHSALVPLINGALRGQQIARAFSELRCTFGGRSIVPDVSVFVWERIAYDAAGDIANAFLLAPDWTIEILSPDKRQLEMLDGGVVKNIVFCLEHGSQMGWLIDPDDRTVFVYYPDRTMVGLDAIDAVLPVPEFAQDLTMTVGHLFECLAK
ncbi:Uma2 family endonuclease [filamentous cyanobacterium LEGE 11480]|uniref:Uma2 family endonuclease n=1 Tax=Romeriopsis navalis LEGE 11480 TaxID=2777977 RepID=A0A928VR21_9CYAN|nr:Uma2 family endonuclease [Romeriopsis navalis]MBE9032213.1 Uma2 family endonuclease [Romeriopsis navalis LEGE 11480]